jgi:DNA-binding transcriptional MocR family regulator
MATVITESMPEYRFSRRAAVQPSAIRELLRDASVPGMISLAGGMPQAELFDVDGIRQAALESLRQAPRQALQYGPTEGQESLRTALAAHLSARAIRVRPESIQVTTGSQQALDLIARAFLDEGDRVALEVPTYLAAVQAFDLRGAQYLEIPAAADGADVDTLDAALAADRGNPAPKLAYVVSNFANPSGASLSVERRLALLRWAVARGVFLLEDDPYGDLRFRGHAQPPLWVLAQRMPGAAAWCGYVSSLSKTVAPGLRIGWMVLPPRVANTVTRIKQALDLHTSSLAQEVAARYLATGALERRLDSVRSTYSTQCEALCTALHDRLNDEITFTIPDGGMFLWCRFRESVDTAALLSHAREHGVIFVPGAVFYPRSGDPATFRLSFSTCCAEELREGVRRLELALRTYRESGAMQIEAFRSHRR